MISMKYEDCLDLMLYDAFSVHRVSDKCLLLAFRVVAVAGAFVYLVILIVALTMTINLNKFLHHKRIYKNRITLHRMLWISVCTELLAHI